MQAFLPQRDETVGRERPSERRFVPFTDAGRSDCTGASGRSGSSRDRDAGDSSCAADHKPPETLTPAAGCRSAFGARAPSFRAVDDEKPPGSRADAID
jgi:hypothetical protein